MAVNRDIDRLELIVELIDHIRRRLAKVTESADIKARHTAIPWAAIYQMRNLISHDHPAIIPLRIWDTAATKLDKLRAMCRAELDNLPE